MISTVAKSVTAAVAIAAALGATTVQAASAKSGDGVRVAGTCSDTSSSKLKVKHDDRRLAVEFEVDQNRNGVPWTVELRKDGRLVFQGTRTTLAPSGSFSLERRIVGTTGTVTASATRAGEGCSATIKVGKGVKAVATVARPPRSRAPTTIPSASTTTTDSTVNDDHGHHGNDD